MTEPSSKKRKPDPCSFVIFGATGDLTHRLVLPALYNLAAADLLPEKFCVVGVARSGMSNDDMRESLLKGLRQYKARPIDEAIAKRLLECVTSIEADPSDPASFDAMAEQLNKLEAKRETGGNRLFYLATPPSAFTPIAKQLGRAGMLKENGSWRRLVVEKPFGTSLASAKALNDELLKIADEQQIYRIDHYLGKETVQNILVLRFANGMFEPIWNRNHIDHVQITVDEKLDVGHRGSFYDATGALRDMVPNHLFQLSVAGGDGAAGEIRGPCGALGEGRSAGGDPDPDRRRSAEEFGARPVSGRQESATPRSRTIARPRTSNPTARPRPTPH